MSHFSRISKANIVDPKAFESACKELGLTEISYNTEIKDWSGKREKVDVAARVDARYSVGIQKVGNKYDLLCDFSMCHPSDQVRTNLKGVGLQDRLTALATKHTLISNYRRLGFMARVSENEKNEITVTLTR